MLLFRVGGGEHLLSRRGMEWLRLDEYTAHTFIRIDHDYLSYIPAVLTGNGIIFFD